MDFLEWIQWLGAGGWCVTSTLGMFRSVLLLAHAVLRSEPPRRTSSSPPRQLAPPCFATLCSADALLRLRRRHRPKPPTTLGASPDCCSRHGRQHHANAGAAPSRPQLIEIGRLGLHRNRPSSLDFSSLSSPFEASGSGLPQATGQSGARPPNRRVCPPLVVAERSSRTGSGKSLRWRHGALAMR